MKQESLNKSKKVKIAIVILKVAGFLAVPFITTLWLYPLGERIIWNSGQYHQSWFQIEDILGRKKPTLRNLFADALSAPLYLDWYTVSIVSTTTMHNPNCIENEPVTARFMFVEGDPREYQTNLQEDVDSNGYESKFPFYYFKGQQSAFFIAPSWKKYSLDVGPYWGGGCILGNLQLETTTPEISTNGNFQVSIKPHWTSWWARYILINVFWLFLFTSLLALFAWAKE